MKLNFTMSELINSNEAKKYGINNIPNDKQILDNLLVLITECLQPIRDISQRAFIITSGYRCQTLNSLPSIRGAKNSQHLTGQAADFVIKGLTVDEAYNFIKKSNVKYTQLIKEKNQWIHISYCKNNLKCENLIFNGKDYIKDLI